MCSAMVDSMSSNDATNEGVKRILVVDDEPLLCRMVGAMLKKAGYEIVTANNGAQALEAVADKNPDLITLDVMMPDMSGLDVARRLRSSNDTARIPIVFVTALDRTVSSDLRTLSSEPGIYHVDKPFSREQLVTQVSIALENRREAAGDGRSHG